MLTQWTEHINRLCSQLTGRGHHPLVLRGGMSKKARQAVLTVLDHEDENERVLLVATGSYLGEGFDCPQLDTLFLAFPLAFKGRIVQYVGRIMRVHTNEQTVEVHDYVDSRVPVLARMHVKRLTGYGSLGFDAPSRRP